MADKIAYLDCISGISGDMFLGACIDLGVPIEEIKRFLKLIITQSSIELKPIREDRHGISGIRLEVKGEDSGKVKSWKEMDSMVLESRLPSDFKNRVREIFKTLAKAEAKIHNISLDNVHFHELGSYDTIVDVVGALFSIDYLKIERIICSPLPLGYGNIKGNHGIIPIPSPATLELLKDVPVYGSGIREELVTPTGALLIKALCDDFGNLPDMEIDAIGYGLGSRDFPQRPNLLRIIYGRPTIRTISDNVTVLEANIDDSNPEWLGYLMERLLNEGALDVTLIPAYMKKNRPGCILQVIGTMESIDSLIKIIFSESSTLGVRYGFMKRRVLERMQREVESPWGKIKVKEVKEVNGKINIFPEFEECKRIAQEQRISLKEIYMWVTSLNAK